MIGAARMFAPRYFAPRYWMKVGVTSVFSAAWMFGNSVVGLDGTRQ